MNRACEYCEHHECFDCHIAMMIEEEYESSDYDSEATHPLDDLAEVEDEMKCRFLYKGLLRT